MKTLKETTQEWIDTQGEWLGNPIHQPALVQLTLLAEGIDADPTKASLHSQFGLTYRSLIAERPKEDQGEDVLDLLLREATNA